MQSFPGEGIQPGASGQVSSKGSLPRPGPGQASGGLQQGILVFFLSIISLLNVEYELPRLLETGQLKGISPLTCDVKIL